jgi:NTE family protein
VTAGYVIFTTMVVVYFFFIVGLALFATPAYSKQRTMVFSPDYRVVHGGIRTAVRYSNDGLPRLGIALAGGGAKAAASVGVLKVLQQEGIPVAAVAGTSMGAGVGGLFAAGYSPEQIEEIFLGNDWNDIFNDRPSRAFLTQEQKEAGSRHLLEFQFQDGRLIPPYGLTGGQKLMKLLASKTLAASFEADLDFNRLKVPFRAVATDIETGEAVALDRGLLYEAIRASIAIPLVFQPVEIQGRLLVDGGLVNNLPVEIVRSMGADIVIAVDSSAKLEKRDHLKSLFEIMSQSISLPVRRESERQAALADLVITPDTTEYSFTDFPIMKQIIGRGEEAARAAMPRIRELMKPRNPADNDSVRYLITSLKIQGNSHVPEAPIRSAMARVIAPREATATEIRGTLSEVYALGHFSDVSLSVEREGAGYDGVLTVAENPLVTSMTVTGATVISKTDIMKALSWQIGQPLSTTRLAEDLDLIISQYKSEGYVLAHVERTAMLPDGTLEIRFREGLVDAISVTGHRTSRTLIRRETVTRAGKPLNFDAAARDVQRLYALDYFESVTADMKKNQNGNIDLTLRFKEKPTNKVRLGLRFDTEDYFTGLTDFMVDNVGGRGVKVFLNTRYGNYQDFTLGYRSPVVLRANFLHTVDAFYQARNYNIYENEQRIRELEITRRGVGFSFGYQWFRFGDTYLRYRYAHDRATEAFTMNSPTEITRIGSLAFMSAIDTRDSSTFPRGGSLVKFMYETANPAYGGSAEYRKTFLSAQRHMPFGERHNIIAEATGGFGSGPVPYEEKYGIGGADYVVSVPLLGYQRREFTGSDLLALSAAYRFRLFNYQLNLVKAVYLNAAFQAANVWDARDEMSIGDLRSGAGIGLHADTVIGPVRLDLGRAARGRYAVYFSAGFDF